MSSRKLTLPETDALARVRGFMARRAAVQDVIAARGLTETRFNSLFEISREIRALLPTTGVFTTPHVEY